VPKSRTQQVHPLPFRKTNEAATRSVAGNSPQQAELGWCGTSFENNNGHGHRHVDNNQGLQFRKGVAG
jgi:hypothetical protein